MARKFDAGSEVVRGEGAVFKNAKIGGHTALLDSIIHLGNFTDVFAPNGHKKEIKKPANVVLATLILMGKNDLNDDGSRIKVFTVFGLKSGPKANMTSFLDAIDPEELTTGWDDCCGRLLNVNMVGSAKLGEDGSPKYVNYGGVSAASEDAIEMAEVRVKKEEIVPVGAILFDDITEEIMRLIPAQHIRNYLLGEGNGTPNTFTGSNAEKVLNLIREEDKDFAVKRNHSDKENKESKPVVSTPTELPDAPELDELDEEEEI